MAGRQAGGGNKGMCKESDSGRNWNTQCSMDTPEGDYELLFFLFVCVITLSVEEAEDSKVGVGTGRGVTRISNRGSRKPWVQSTSDR